MLISECCCNPSRDVADRALYIWFVLGFPDSGRNDGCPIMLSHLVVGSVDLLVVPSTVMYNRSFTVIAYSGAAEPQFRSGASHQSGTTEPSFRLFEPLTI